MVDLYANAENKWDKGDTLEIPFLVDNTAPTIEKVEVDHENNVLRVTASDNQQVAGVALYDVTGRTLLASCGSDPDAKPGDTVTLEVPLDYVDGYKFVIQVVDYAVNKTTYKLKETIGEPGPKPEMLYFNSSAKEWMIGNWPAEPGHILMDSWFDGETDVTAATAVGSYIFYVDSNNNLYAGPGDNLWESAYICTLDVTLKDMTYDWDNGILYAVTSTGMLVQVDRMSGTVTELGKVDVGSAYYNAATIAYAGSGLFYCTRDGSYPMLYSFTLDTMNSSTSFSYLEPSYSRGNQCLEYNRADGKLYYVLKTSSGYELWKLSTETPTTGGEYRYFFNDVTAIVFPDWSEHANDWFDPNGKVSAVTLDKAEAELFRDKTLQLSAQVMPWNAADRTVTWSSDNTEVATVDANGLVTGVGIGTANITAAATADPSVTASCQVTVSVLNVDLSGVLIDSDNQSRFYTWNTANDKIWTPGATVAKDAIAASLTPDGSKFWMLDNSNVTYEMDAATGEVVSGPYTSLIDQFYTPHGIAYSAQFSTEEQPLVYYIRDGQLSYPRDPASTDSMSFLSLGYSTKHKNLTSVTCAGTEVYNRFGTDYDSDVLYMTDDLGRVWRANVYHVVTPYSSSYNIAYTTTESTLPENVFTSKDFSSLVLGEDGALYLSAYSGDASTLYRLTYNADTNVYEAMGMGTYGNKVWPALLLSVTDNDGESEDASAAEPFRGFVAERSVQPQLQSAVTAAARPLSVNPGQGSENTVTLDLNAENATNGKLTVSYDADVLTLTAVDAAGMTLTSYLSEDGTLTFGYAAKDAVSGKLATLHFAYDRSTCPISTTVTVSTLEENEDTDRASENVTLKLRDVVVIPGEPGKPTEPSFPFKDVTTDHPFYEDIKYVYEKGLMQGVSEDIFQSATTTTRGMIATILYRMEGEPAVKNASSFRDVADGMYYSNAVAWAAANGIVNGYADGTFQPDQTISREQMAAILYRYAQYKGCDVSVGEDTNILSYTDVAQVASYAVPAFQWAVGAGIINGTAATTLSPKGSATRGQVAAILHRYCEWIG